MKMHQDQKAEYNLIWEIKESLSSVKISRFILWNNNNC